ncbi:MAG: prepilin-type cleavage/methylation domain-containing protein [Candidatus Omnitrophica bacterium]|nr:prepilin-type cleavage/methylation domain-containing protein [Candidatus Omnitrophota bacterium]
MFNWINNKIKRNFCLCPTPVVNGFTVVEIFIAIIILAILILAAVPNFINMMENARKNICISNLRQIKLAKDQWAIENNMTFSATPTSSDLDMYVKNGISSLYCPLDPTRAFSTSYTINEVGTNPVCKIKPGTHKL